MELLLMECWQHVFDYFTREDSNYVCLVSKTFYSKLI